MKFTIDLTKNDIAAFNTFSAARLNNSPGIKWKVTVFTVVYWLLPIFFILEIFSAYHEQNCYLSNHLNRALLAIGIWFFLINIWNKIYTHLLMTHGYIENGTILGRWNVELSDTAITESNQLCSSTFS